MNNKRSKRIDKPKDDDELTDKENSQQGLPKRIRIEQQIEPLLTPELNGSVIDTKRCGKIMRIHLENFMCHSNLSIEFGPVTNFLVGSNGSGKSAILTALVVGLGSSARISSRSSTVHKFIRFGEPSAKVEIQLFNGAVRAHKRHLYGDSIIITRIIKPYGSTYTLKDSRGNVVSRKVDELRNMLLAFNIRVENPIFILNQESAREFLKDLEPKKNYQLFMKASQLDIVFESLAECTEIYQKQTVQLETIKEATRNLEKDIAKCKEKLYFVNHLNELKTLLPKFRIQLAWFGVSFLEKQLEEIGLRITNLESKKQELTRMLEDRHNAEKDLINDLRKIEENVKQLNEKQRELNQAHRLIKADISRLADSEYKLEEDIRDEKKYIATAKENKLIVENRINCYEQIKSEIEDLKQEHAEQIRELLQNIPKLEEKLSKDEANLHKLRIQHAQYSSSSAQIKERKENILRTINNKRGEISTLNANKQNVLSIFGRSAIQLDQDIQQAYERGRFSKMPKGPLGRYIKVPNTKSRDIVENLLRPLLSAYAVSSHEDCKVINALLRRYPNYNPTIITTHFLDHVYNVSRHCVHPPNQTYLLLDQICCEDSVVMNIIIDQIRAETILLTESKSVAEAVSSGENDVPTNLSKVFVVYPNKFMEYHVAPHYAMYSSKLAPAKVIQINIDDRIRQLEGEITGAEETLCSLNKELQEIANEEKMSNEALSEKKNVVNNLSEHIQNVKQKLYELEHYEYQEQIGVEALKTQHADIERSFLGMEEKLKKLELSISALRGEKEILNKKEQENRDESNKFDRAKDECGVAKEKVNNLLQDIRNRLSTVEEEIKAVKLQLQTELGNRAKIESSITNASQKAAKLGDRIESEHDETELSEMIDECEHKIAEYSRLTINAEEVSEELENKTSEAKEMIEECHNLERTVQCLYTSLTNRFKLVKRIRDGLVITVNHYFQRVLNSRKFSGRIDVNNEDETLVVSVTPPKYNSENGIHSTRGLSGGERSFTTVALLKALWAISDHPFYFMDEYDVFTDEVNRQVITESLLDEGAKNPHRQYCFLTPLDTKVDYGGNIKIHRLAEPDRQRSRPLAVS